MAVTTKIYSNTLAKQNEGRLLSEEKLRRLCDADFQGAVKMLTDYGYGGGRLDENSFDVDKLIAAETARLIDFVENDCYDPVTANVLLAKFVYNNAKARYKFRLGAADDEGALYDVEDDKSVGVLSGNYGDCPEPMAQAAKALDDMNLRGKVTAADVDREFTTAMYADMSTGAKKCGGAVKKYVTAKIDFVNLTAALRLMRIGGGAKELEELYIPGGKLSLDDIAEAMNAGINGFAEKLRDTDYYDALKRVSEKGFDALALFESDAAAAENSFFDGDLENMLSDAPFLHYYAAALNEFKSVKVILTCVRNNVKAEINIRVRWS